MKVLAISSNLTFCRADMAQTKVVRYKHTADAYGFNYTLNPTFYQQFRMGLVFGRIPKYPTKEKVYRQTDGTFRSQNTFIDKQFTLKTDYLDILRHEAMHVALKHSDVYIDGVKFFCQGDYEIQGDDDETLTNLTTAQAAILQQGYNKTSLTC